MNIGHAIRFLRKQKGWTQSQLADFSHTTKSTISNLESGNQSYSAALLQHLAQALDCPISRIFVVAEQLQEVSDEKQIWDKLPIELLFQHLSEPMQLSVRQLMKQILLEQEKLK
ncbi:helix-turn-helix domain-containing protein [Wielerella bovis]|uniref:helix-turn-helix domain-containing protein n=1 Tax=Wielerella bovis TaxID=2917790 RepID=UPI0020184733|nr:helix-turn-helix transcriptional regulator [Wielerella bovis]ULJ62031.1 helix-turn-helix domain-containing protein [Wielerella bovis]